MTTPVLTSLRLDDAGLDTMRAQFDRCGLLLVRGCKLDAAGFEKLTTHFCDRFHHVGARQATRCNVGDGFTTAVPSQNFILLGHSEGYYRPTLHLPDVCFFMCLIPPNVDGGETTLIDGVAMLNQLSPPLRQRLEAQGVIYECLWEPPRWRAEFDVADETALHAFLARFPAARYTLTDGLLHLFYATPAIFQLPDGTSKFANGILAHLPQVTHPRYAGLPVHAKPTNRVYFGDGELVPDQVVNTLIDAHDTVLYGHRWQARDMLIIDNTRYMHGRNMTSSPCERTLISRFGCLKAIT